jgi:hypothetical protein
LRAAVPHELTRQWARRALSAPEGEAAEWSAYDYTARNAAPAREAPATEAKAPPADEPMAQRFRASLNENNAPPQICHANGPRSPFSKANLHPGIEENHEIYQFMPASFVARMRLLLTYRTLDDAATGIADLDDGIRELREVLPAAVTESS